MRMNRIPILRLFIWAVIAGSIVLNAYWLGYKKLVGAYYQKGFIDGRNFLVNSIVQDIQADGKLNVQIEGKSVTLKVEQDEKVN